MRHVFIIAAMSLLCTACSAEDKPAPGNQWFSVYQSDRTCQGSHPIPPENPFEEGPTGRAHPF